MVCIIVKNLYIKHTGFQVHIILVRIYIICGIHQAFQMGQQVVRDIGPQFCTQAWV